MTPLEQEAAWPKAKLDSDYGARASVPAAVFEAEMQRYRALSEVARARVGTFFDVQYDPTSGQSLDIYGTKEGESRPVFVFIHGGYWRSLSKHDSAFMAPMLAAKGIATAVIDYRLAPQVDLAEIVREVRAGLAFLWREGAQFGLDTDRIFVGGSSAGGHLTGTLLSGGWHSAYDVPRNIIKGGLPVSGLFDLAPVVKSFVQEWITLTPAEVKALSPAANLPQQGCPVIVAYAAGEPAGFVRQSREYARLWQEAGFPTQMLEIDGKNHFDVILDLTDPEAMLSQALIKLISADS